MTALERVMQLKGQGKNESEIIATLRAEGVAPMQISDAINQSKIKEAIVDPNPTAGMTPSIMQDTEAPAPTPNAGVNDNSENQENAYVPESPSEPQAPQSYAPQPAAGGYEPQSYGAQPQQFAGQDPWANDGGYQDQGYGGYDQGYDDYGGGYGGSTDTMIEVAEQVFSEKMKKLSREIRELTEFKTLFEVKVDNLSERVKRMEKHFDSMQLQILEKVSEYGKGLDSVKKEMKMVEDSFGKFAGKL